MEKETSKTNLLNPINNYPIFFILGIGIIILVIAIFLIIFKVTVPTTQSSTGTPSSNQSIAANVMIVLFFIFLLFIICISLLPSLKVFKDFLLQIKNVIHVVIYTIFLILFFRLMPENIINNYANIITPISIFLAIYMFYKAFQQNYIEIFNVNYERIKTIILMFCLITLFIIYYVTDPGGYITGYFGYSMVLSIVLTVFIFLYLIILITIPEDTKKLPDISLTNNLLHNFSKFSVWGSISFITFIVIVTVGIYTSGISQDSNNKSSLAAVIILLLLAFILWGILLILNIFPNFPKITNIGSMGNTEKINYFKKALLVLFGLIISGLLIGWISYNIQHLTGSSSVISFILNICLIIVVLGLVYKTVIVQMPYGNARKNAFFGLLMNVIFYIPCLFTETFDYIMQLFIGQYNTTTTGSILLLLLSIVLLVLYFILPLLYNKVNLQGGKLLVNQPVYTNTSYSLGTYKDLNESEVFDYQYAISFWVFLDASPPNSNENSNHYTSILNFGNKPNVLYNRKTNSLIVTMQSDVKVYNKENNNKIKNVDANDNTILYKNDKVLLQKWNNMIINYNGGILDIFLNGELVKSISGVVPYYKLDNLTIGEDNGVNGGICNVVYFKKPVTSINIYYLYNMVKSFNPPVTETSNYTIIKDKLTAAKIK
jgi:hypothetical protein